MSLGIGKINPFASRPPSETAGSVARGSSETAGSVARATGSETAGAVGRANDAETAGQVAFSFGTPAGVGLTGTPIGGNEIGIG